MTDKTYWQVIELGGREAGRFESVRDALPTITILCHIERKSVALVGWYRGRPVELMVWTP